MRLEAIISIRSRYDRIYQRAYQTAFKSQLMRIKQVFSDTSSPDVALRKVETNIDYYIKEEDIRPIYEELYYKVGAKFLDITLRELSSKLKQERMALVSKDTLFQYGTDRWAGHVKRYLADNAGNRITWVTQNTQGFVLSNLRDVLVEGADQGRSVPQMQREFRGKIDELEKLNRYRATRIARTEILTASNYGSYAGAEYMADKHNMVLDKKWLTMIDGKERPEHNSANGQITPMKGRFEVMGEQLMYPGDPVGSAKNIIHCRCTLTYMSKGPTLPRETPTPPTPEPPVTPPTPAPPKPVAPKPTTTPVVASPKPAGYSGNMNDIPIPWEPVKSWKDVKAVAKKYKILDNTHKDIVSEYAYLHVNAAGKGTAAEIMQARNEAWNSILSCIYRMNKTTRWTLKEIDKGWSAGSDDVVAYTRGRLSNGIWMGKPFEKVSQLVSGYRSANGWWWTSPKFIDGFSSIDKAIYQTISHEYSHILTISGGRGGISSEINAANKALKGISQYGDTKFTESLAELGTLLLNGSKVTIKDEWIKEWNRYSIWKYKKP